MTSFLIIFMQFTLKIVLLFLHSAKAKNSCFIHAENKACNALHIHIGNSKMSSKHSYTKHAIVLGIGMPFKIITTISRPLPM